MTLFAILVSRSYLFGWWRRVELRTTYYYGIHDYPILRDCVPLCQLSQYLQSLVRQILTLHLPPHRRKDELNSSYLLNRREKWDPNGIGSTNHSTNHCTTGSIIASFVPTFYDYYSDHSLDEWPGSLYPTIYSHWIFNVVVGYNTCFTHQGRHTYVLRWWFLLFQTRKIEAKLLGYDFGYNFS